jgi:HEAT repeat protein
VYFTDWVEGWKKPNKGRLYRVSSPIHAKSPLAHEVKKLLAEGMAHRSTEELVKLLQHADMRVRQEAQFTLADKGSASIPALTEVAHRGKDRLARLHAIWGLGQIARRVPAAHEATATLLSDNDAEVRCQAAKVLGDGDAKVAAERLTALLKDSEDRVRFFAAMSLGRLRQQAAVRPILDMLRQNADRDAYVRHAGVMALARIGDGQAENARALASLQRDRLRRLNCAPRRCDI